MGGLLICSQRAELLGDLCWLAGFFLTQEIAQFGGLYLDHPL